MDCAGRERSKVVFHKRKLVSVTGGPASRELCGDRSISAADFGVLQFPVTHY